ncbi:unnamed protein product [Rotaria magnacalcarata]
MTNSVLLNVQSIIELLLLKIFFHQLWCWAMVDIQLLNVLLILLLTAQTTKHRKDSLCETKKSALLILRNTGFSSTNITIIVVERM